VSYSLHILPRAETDFVRIFYYIAERSPDGAERWREAFTARTKRIQQNPNSCGLAQEDSHFDFELRQLLFKTRYGHTYRAVYRVEDNDVYILRICGAGQAPLSPDEIPLK